MMSHLSVTLTLNQKQTFLSGLTAANANKTIISSWFPPNSLSKQQWLSYFIDIVRLERSTALINRAKIKTIMHWNRTHDSLISILKT